MMLKKNLNYVFLFLISVLSLFSFQGDTHANRPIGDEIQIAHTEIDEIFPKIAFNSSRGEYLVVYWNNRSGCDDIYAQRIAGDGSVLNGYIAISWGCDADRRHPDVAYNSKHDQYLIVWERTIGSQTWIMGKRLSGEGVILDSIEIEIGSCRIDNEPCEKPAVEYAFTSDQYYVVWLINIAASDGKFVAGQVVNTNGSLGEPETFNIISDTTERERTAPSLAYNRHENQYLVVWSEKRPGTYWEIRSHQLTGSGYLVGNEILIADNLNKHCTQPDVAAIPTTSTDDKFLIVWEFWYDDFDPDIRGRMMSEEGGLGDIIMLASTTDYEFLPRVAGSESSKQFMVTWTNGNTLGLWSQSVSETGEILSDTVRSSVPGTFPSNGDLAAGPVGDFLAVYFDDDTRDEVSSLNVYGQLFGLRIYLPLILR